MTSSQVRGLVQLVHEGIDAGSARVEEIQRASISRVVSIVAVVVPPAAIVGSLVLSSVTLTHRALRLVSRGVAALTDRVLRDDHLG